MTHVMIEREWFDTDFVRRWTNAPLLVRSDTGRLLRGDEVSPAGDPDHYVAWDEASGRPVAYDPAQRRFALDEDRLALWGAHEVATSSGPQLCRPGFDLVAEQCPSAAAGRRRVDHRCARGGHRRAQPRTLWDSRPVAFYAWSGLEQHSNATQTVRAINVLYALTGSLDVLGGNVLFTGRADATRSTVPACSSPEQRAKAIGLSARPLGGGRFGVHHR